MLLSWGFLLSTVVAISVAMKNSDHLILQGTRCVSRCLQNHAKALLKHRKTLNASEEINPLKWCAFSKAQTCSSCIRPCEQRFATLPQCMAFCEGDIDCMYSCAYFEDISGTKMGYCPAPTAYNSTLRTPTNLVPRSSLAPPRGHSDVRSARNCTSTCRTDYDCRSNRKCCVVNCRGFCRPPLSKQAWLPLKLPRRSVTIRETDDGQSAVLIWTQEKNFHPVWTMYLVQQQYRLSRGIPKRFRKWQTITQTSMMSATLVHLRRGYWYRFRVAPVNVNGTKGFTLLEQPFRLSAPPRRPPAPSNLEQVSLRIARGGKYSIQIRWKLVDYADSDLPITGFHVTWVRRSVTGNRVRHGARRRFVKVRPRARITRNKQWTLWLRRMRMYVSYNVSVVTSSGWINSTQFSRETIIQVKFPHDTPKQQISSFKVAPPFLISNNRVSVNITWRFQFTEAPESVVRFMVEWRSQFCLDNALQSTTDREITNRLGMLLDNLQMACHYIVSVQALYGSMRHQWSNTAITAFFTPPCGVMEPNLLRTSNDSCSFGTVPSRPRKLTATKLPGTRSVVVNWRAPRFPNTWSDFRLVGYFMYSDARQQRGLNYTWSAIPLKVTPHWQLRDLRPDRVYQVHVLAVYSLAAAGLEASMQIST